MVFENRQILGKSYHDHASRSDKVFLGLFHDCIGKHLNDIPGVFYQNLSN